MKIVFPFKTNSYIICIFVICGYFSNCVIAVANKPQPLAKIIVVESYINAQNATKYSVDNGHCLYFYREGDNLCFANDYPKQNSKSFGKVNDKRMKKCTEKGMEAEVVRFIWSWQNTYDSSTGKADVYIKILNMPQGKACRVVIIGDTLENVLEYRGVLNGNINF
jgi:hypothetical protein